MGAEWGGKGVNLVELRHAGFPVPEFVIVPTSEYIAYTATGVVTPEQRARLLALVGPLLDGPVAVRSSATAEDLPDASFAGQHDTFLNVTGEGGVIEAILACWASLWTPRAVSYRAQQHIPDEGLALAVVVQRMVVAEASGVLFTADPLTGDRGRTVIDAVFGLGEALVSGQVTPDHYEVETASGRVVVRRIEGREPTLSSGQVRALTELGQRVEQHFGQPQDIEWVRVGDDISLVQSRAVTTLFPIPEPRPDKAFWISFGAFQGMLAPLTPLGSDVLRMALSGVAGLAGRRKVDWRRNPWLRPAGGRLWVRLDGMLSTAATRRVLWTVLPAGEPGSLPIIRALADERGEVERRFPRPATLRGLARSVRTVLGRLPRTMRHPEDTRREITAGLLAVPSRVRDDLAAVAALPTPQARLSGIGRAMDSFAARFFGVALPLFGPVMAPTFAMVHRLRTLAARTGLPDADALAMGVLRALPDNVTTEMDLALADAADVIRADEASREAFSSLTDDELASAFLGGTLPGVAQEAVSSFLAKWGVRGPGEIDMGAPRWSDDPTGVVHTLVSYVAVDDPAMRPRAAFERGREEALVGIDRLAAASGPVAARQIRFAARRIRGLFGVRETPKFAIIASFGEFRTALRASGRELVAAGRLSAPDDIFFLHRDELDDAFVVDHRDAVAGRRAGFDREARRPRVPRVLVADGRTFYDAPGSATGDLTGMGVSPGMVEGDVRVVFDPSRSGLLPGEVLVCPGTDPAWTPLFLTASALVTEVGGLMTHGSVVAREYGIPAVVGVPDATSRLQTGQRVRIDGSSGTIVLLDP